MSINQNGHITTSETVKANKLTTRNIETPSDNTNQDILIKADNVQFIGLHNVCYWNATRYEAKYFTNMYVDYGLTARDGVKIGTEGGYNSPVGPFIL